MRLSLSRFGSILVLDNGLVWDDALRHRQVPLDARALEAIQLFAAQPEQMAHPDQAAKHVGSDVIGLLRTLEILVADIEPRHEHERSLLETWRRWPTLTRLYNFSTRLESTDNLVEPTEANSWLASQEELDPAPERFSEGESDSVALPTMWDDSLRGATLSDGLDKRRTVRCFTPEVLDFRVLASLLKKSAALSETRGRSESDRKYMNYFRSAPSAGARASTEVYVVAMRVDGLAVGSYRYNPVTHSLTRVGEAPNRTQLNYALGGQSWLFDCPAFIVYSIYLPSLMWKYPHSRTYRIGLLDVGHISQSLIMAAWGLGLGSNFTAFFREQEFEDILSINPATEVIAGVCGLGYAAEADPHSQGLHE